MLGRTAAGGGACRELLRPGNLLRGVFITHFLPLLLGCEAVAAGLCVILSWMQLWFAGRSRSGGGDAGGHHQPWQGHNLLSPPGKNHWKLPSQGFGAQIMEAVVILHLLSHSASTQEVLGKAGTAPRAKALEIHGFSHQPQPSV